MTSSARRAFEAHTAAVRAGDLESIVAGYAPDAVLADRERIGRGRDYIRSVYAAALDAAAVLEPSMEILEDGDVRVQARLLDLRPIRANERRPASRGQTR